MATDQPNRNVDPEKNAAYWERIRRVVDQAPPLTDGQRARLRSIFHSEGR